MEERRAGEADVLGVSRGQVGDTVACFVLMESGYVLLDAADL